MDESVVEFERRGLGKKRFFFICSELRHRYKDACMHGRTSYEPPSLQDIIFYMVIKEFPQTSFIDKLVLATVTDIKRRKPNRQELNRAKSKQKRNYWLVAMPVLSAGKIGVTNISNMSSIPVIY